MWTGMCCCSVSAQRGKKKTHAMVLEEKKRERVRCKERRKKIENKSQ